VVHPSTHNVTPPLHSTNGFAIFWEADTMVEDKAAVQITAADTALNYNTTYVIRETEEIMT